MQEWANQIFHLFLLIFSHKILHFLTRGEYRIYSILLTRQSVFLMPLNVFMTNRLRTYSIFNSFGKNNEKNTAIYLQVHQVTAVVQRTSNTNQSPICQYTQHQILNFYHTTEYLAQVAHTYGHQKRLAGLRLPSHEQHRAAGKIANESTHWLIRHYQSMVIPDSGMEFAAHQGVATDFNCHVSKCT